MKRYIKNSTSKRHPAIGRSADGSHEWIIPDDIEDIDNCDTYNSNIDYRMVIRAAKRYANETGIPQYILEQYDYRGYIPGSYMYRFVDQITYDKDPGLYAAGEIVDTIYPDDITNGRCNKNVQH